jgi:N-acetylmuramoyl-L-alanine amidase
VGRDDVLALQRLLNALGPLLGATWPPIAVDGLAGGQTRQRLYDALRAATAFLPGTPAIPAIAGQPLAQRPIWGLVVHCTAAREGQEQTAEQLRQMHMSPGWQGSPTGWSDIGYHYVVRRDGTVERGRPEAKVGAHVKEANKGTLGVVYVGGCDVNGKPKDTRTAAQKKALLAVCEALAAKYPIEWVKGHNDFTDAKACPSFDVANDPLGRLV